MKLETDRNKIVENNVAAILASKWNCEYGSMGPYSPYDIYFHRDGKLSAIAEIKQRSNRNSDSFKTVFLNLDKWFTLFQCELFLKKPAFYIIEFMDGIFYTRIGELPVNEYNILFKGREDRGAKNDKRAVVEILTCHFTKAV